MDLAKVYFFRGTDYLRYDAVVDQADLGYPASIGNEWPGLSVAGFASNIDAAVNWGNGKAYFFNSDKYVRYDIAMDKVDPGYPVAIAGAWPGVAEAGFASGIDAVVNWAGDKAWFFKGDKCLSYRMISPEGVEAGYPVTIATAFPSLAQVGFGSGLDSAVNWGNGKAYFFKGDKYVRYDIAANQVDAGYPIAIHGAWPGMGEVGFGHGLQAVLPYEPWFGDGVAINGYFLAKTGQTFINWFKANHAMKGEWAVVIGGNVVAVSITTGPAAELRFVNFWQNVPAVFGTKLITLNQFVALMSIVINETGGSLQPKAEKMPTTGAHPGLAYAFDSQPKSAALPNGKASYNTAPNNKTALALFSDAVYNGAHGGLALGPQLQGTQDPVWGGSVYPQAGYPTVEDVNQTGYLMQADFYKFRGRGMIQTTFRSAYLSIIKWIQAYNGSHPKVLQYKSLWAGKDPTAVATASTTEQWDDLFLATDLVIPCAAISIHNKGGFNYLKLSFNDSVLLGTLQGSFYNVGLKVSGGGAYATKFKARVLQILNSL